MAIPGFIQTALFLLTAILIYRVFRSKSTPRPPSGPRPIPIIGNIFDLPRPGELEYRHWLTHKDKYGPISSVTLLGQRLVIIHDEDAAQHLLVAKAVQTCERPSWEFGSRMCGYGNLLSSSQCNDFFRRGRKFFHQQLGQNVAAAEKNRDIIEAEVGRFLQRVLHEPGDLIGHIKTQAGAIILQMTYGYSIDRNKADPLVSLVEKMMANMSVANVPLTWAVDTINFLKYLPESLPGMTFKKTAREWNQLVEATAEEPYAFVRRQMNANSHRPSYVSRLVETLGNGSVLNPDDEYAIKWSAATIYSAGSDSTVLAISCCILALIIFPEVQRKAHEEIDRLVGEHPHRLPCFSDRESLPYIDAMVKESIRWVPITPMGFSHVTTDDLPYDDFVIPKGAYLLPAVWWFLHDPSVYKDPESFQPERFLEPRNEPDPSNSAFGYGRRICPGRFFADDSIFLSIVQLLAAFTVGKATDARGEEMEAELRVTPGVATHLVGFPYKIEPRSEGWADLVGRISVE
ncbi:hypothetical protein CP533_4221 [Ophiocordyceps camponoti-saundersi (nom. inval.)]|nr:hypothetical protein CP533_4221 [Ophiocordyceps camponoti-saundersi (nom. inval.)]